MSETWEPLYNKWHSAAYRGCKKPTKSQAAERKREFLKMVKLCICGEWHLEFNSECRKCKPKESRANLPSE